MTAALQQQEAITCRCHCSILQEQEARRGRRWSTGDLCSSHQVLFPGFVVTIKEAARARVLLLCVSGYLSLASFQLFKGWGVNHDSDNVQCAFDSLLPGRRFILKVVIEVDWKAIVSLVPFTFCPKKRWGFRNPKEETEPFAGCCIFYYFSRQMHGLGPALAGGMMGNITATISLNTSVNLAISPRALSMTFLWEGLKHGINLINVPCRL